MLDQEKTKRESSLGKIGARTAGADSLLRLYLHSELDFLRWEYLAIYFRQIRKDLVFKSIIQTQVASGLEEELESLNLKSNC